MKEIRRGIRKLLEINENEYTIDQILWEKVKAILREICSNECLHQKSRKISSEKTNNSS
jgi:hypothetical protein